MYLFTQFTCQYLHQKIKYDFLLIINIVNALASECLFSGDKYNLRYEFFMTFLTKSYTKFDSFLGRMVHLFFSKTKLINIYSNFLLYFPILLYHITIVYDQWYKCKCICINKQRKKKTCLLSIHILSRQIWHNLLPLSLCGSNQGRSPPLPLSFSLSLSLYIYIYIHLNTFSSDCFFLEEK